MKRKVIGIVLAGGSGTRLWPLSRDLTPKQSLKLYDNNTLFQSTLLRLNTVIPDIEILTITNQKLKEDLQRQIQELQIDLSDKFLVEPIGRNTAPAICVSALYAQEGLALDEDPILFITPSDHIIKNVELFRNAVMEAINQAEKGSIVTFGIQPTFPNTGYGYIKVFKNESKSYKVASFTEKPDEVTALGYINSGDYYWNSGIFMARASVLLNEFQKFTPDLYNTLKDLSLEAGIPYDLYQTLQSISIDYAVMEKTDKAVLVPMNVGWSDIGCWDLVYNELPQNSNNVVINGNVIDIDSKNSLIYSTGKLVATIGVENMAIIETDDALLVCSMDRAGEVNKIYNKLKEMNHEAYRSHATVQRPWGYTATLEETETSATKSVCVNSHEVINIEVNLGEQTNLTITSGSGNLLGHGKKVFFTAGNNLQLSKIGTYFVTNDTAEPLKFVKVTVEMDEKIAPNTLLKKELELQKV